MKKQVAKLGITLPWLLLSACGTATLRDYADATIHLEATPDGLVRVTLGEPGGGGCKTLDRPQRARLNGLDLTVDSLGGELQTGGGWTCSEPSFSLPERAAAAMGPDLHLELSDLETTIVVEALDVFAQRSLTLSPTTGGTADREGSAWRFLWLPRSDSDRSAVWRLQVEGMPPLFGEASLEGDLVHVRLPEGATTGALTVLAVEGQARASVTRCEGIAACSVGVHNSSGELRLSALLAAR